MAFKREEAMGAMKSLIDTIVMELVSGLRRIRRRTAETICE